MNIIMIISKATYISFLALFYTARNFINIHVPKYSSNLLKGASLSQNNLLFESVKTLLIFKAM